MKQIILLLLLVPILHASSWGQRPARRDEVIAFRQIVVTGPASYRVTLAFPGGVDLKEASAALRARLRSINLQTFEVAAGKNGRVMVTLRGVERIDSMLRLVLTGEGVVEITATRPDDGWLLRTVERLTAERSLPLVVADTAGALTITRTKRRPDAPSVPLMPAKLIEPLDSAAASAGKALGYEPDPENLRIHIIDPASSLDLGLLDSVSARIDRTTHGFILSIHPSQKRKKAIADFTAARIGKGTVFTIDDRVVASPTIRSRIESADIDIAFAPSSDLERVREYAFLLSLQRLPGRPVIVSEEMVE